jgi:hypothetical protein
MIRHAPLALILMLAAGPALAAEPANEAATATAPSDVADQIAAYLRDSPVVQLPPGGGARATVELPLDRRPHGVVEVGVGSHGYRSAYVQTEIPLGEDGMLSLAIGERRGGLTRSGPGLPGVGGLYDGQPMTPQFGR